MSEKVTPRLSRTTEIVDVLSCTVGAAGKPVALTRSERALVFFLATRPQGASRAAIAEAIVPSADEPTAARSLKVFVYRIRAKICAGVIATVPGGYGLPAEMVTDLARVEKLVKVSGSKHDRETMFAVEGLYRRLGLRRSQHFTSGWTWFEDTERRLQLLELDAGVLLARDAMRAGRYERAIEVAHDLIALDPIDERSREIVVRSYLQLEDGAAAADEVQRYAALLRREQAGVPSDGIYRLVNRR